MCKTRNGENVLKLRRKARIRIGRVSVVLLRFICGLSCEKRRVIRVLAMNQRNKSVVCKFLFTAVGYSNLRRTLEGNLALIRLERMGREALNQAAALNTADRDTPAVHRERLGQPCSEC